MKTEIPVRNLLRVINSRNSITADQCGIIGGLPIPIHMVEMSTAGFLGVYSPNPAQIETLLMDNTKGDFTGNVTMGGIYGYSRRRLLAVSAVVGST